MDHLSTSNFISDSEIDHAVRPLTSLIIDRASIPSGDAPRQRRKRTNISQNNSAETSSRAFTVTPSIADRSSIPSGTFQRQRAERHKPIEKVDQVIELLVRLNLSLGEFLLYAIKLPPKKLDPKKGKPWTASHTTMVSKFLKGDSDITMDHIINIIYNHPYGKAPTSSDEHDHMFSPDIPPSSLHFAQPILSTWAVHLVQSQAEKQAKVLAKSDGGLHMRASSILRLNNTTAKTRRHEGQLSWGRISEFSIGGLEAVMKQNAPLLWSLVQGITGREEGKGSKYRPANVVVSGAISALMLARSSHANLLPMVISIWLFGSKAHTSIHRVLSRLGLAVSYNSMIVGLKRLSRQQREHIRDHAQSGNEFYRLVVDNVQAWYNARDMRIGATSRMRTGTAGTAILMEDYPEGAFKLDELMRRVKLIQRKHFTAEILLDDIDQDHLNLIASLHWIKILVRYVPELSKHQEYVSTLFRTRAKKHVAPNRKKTIIPLGTNSENEATVKGMEGAVKDFVCKQMGMMEKELDNTVFPVSGDGMTFDRLNKLKRNSVFHPGRFLTYQWLVPMLELWHTKWTDLSRVSETHWGPTSTKDPSTLWHSASAINRKTPANLKKVDFYPTAATIDVVLKARVLDCWRLHFECEDLIQHFKISVERNTLPAIEDLLKAASVLARRYSSTSAYIDVHRAEESGRCGVPIGRAWASVDVETVENNTSELEDHENGTPVDSSQQQTLTSSRLTNAPTISQSARSDGDAISDSGSDQPFTGDHVLQNAILFLRDSIWWTEFCYAVAEGDTGRVFEILKVWIFTFSGAGRFNYVQYLLELYCNFTYEYPPALRIALLNNWVVNLTGRVGHCIEADLMQEHWNFWLEELAQHKGAEFSNPFYRDVVAMNVQHFLQLKEEMEESVGLTRRSKTHGEPHLRAEYQILLQLYRKTQLHLFRSGRSYGYVSRDDYSEGYEKLSSGDTIPNFITATTRAMDVLGVNAEKQQEVPCRAASVQSEDEEMDVDVDADVDMQYGSDAEEEKREADDYYEDEPSEEQRRQCAFLPAMRIREGNIWLPEMSVDGGFGDDIEEEEEEMEEEEEEAQRELEEDENGPGYYGKHKSEIEDGDSEDL